MTADSQSDRRAFLTFALSGALVLPSLGACASPPVQAPARLAPTEDLIALEAKSQGRLGVGILDTATGEMVGHRLEERFALCSTFKLPLAAEVLRDVDAGKRKLDQFIPYSKADMVAHAPVTEANLKAGGMAIGELAKATQITSDNPAANLILREFGGPEAMTQRIRAAGDPVTRIDRYEPMMNRVVGDDPRDTTSPAAMARLIARYLTTDYLSQASRDLLIGWMIETQTGTKRLRAGLPVDWKAGDKTGTAMSEGMTDKYNDVAIVWPPGRAPLIIAAYFNTNIGYGEMRDEFQAVLAEAGRIAGRWAIA
ncbi:class A beta-lactamase [Aquidulcibacter sp.]|uniref:class A beta-lactamase n=1 Tax=Aquidulcibacter sp. TaxID=2052990 RepID=UPI0025C70F80|nr:class A beta-lactamase [Aquidulcibacter sp.]MCA3696367.1 class A beta-lactamase [Aquidulcibacter sp.]